VIDGSLAVVECDLGTIHDAGHQLVVTGIVRALAVGEGRPLLFYRGQFAQLS
jgi:flavin reductase (DIM6/NTAB) family NADH-FMN oxidoreductase RutF